jgi:hypothetical protein
MWKLAGNRVAEINHRANGAPSVSYLRARLTVPPIVPSPGQPTINEVTRNIEATFGSVLDVVHESKAVHAVIMFDELAMEKKDPLGSKVELLPWGLQEACTQGFDGIHK